MENIYITKKDYIYNKSTCRMYKVSSEVKRILQSYDSKSELLKAEPQLYQSIGDIIQENEERVKQATQIPKVLSELQLMVCNECNLACRYCYANAGTYNKSKGKMAIGTAKSAIDLFFGKYERIEAIVFFGGEPLLNAEVIEQICVYLQENYCGRYTMLGLMSNLYCMTANDVELIKKYHIRVSTSLDGVGKLNAYRVTGQGDESFDQVSHNIKTLIKESNQPEAIEVTMSDLHSDKGYNAEDIKRELSAEYSINNYTVNVVEDFDNRMKGHLYQESSEKPLDVDTLIQEGLCDMRVNDLVAVMKKNRDSNILCYAGIMKFSIFPNGDIFPCQIYCLIEGDEYKMGNVMSIDKNLFARKLLAMKDLANKRTYEKCKNCYASSICSSCLGMCLVNKKEIPHEEAFCKGMEKYHNQLIEAYANIISSPEKIVKFKENLKRANSLCRN